MFSVDINYLAVIVAAVANMVIGFLWYKPMFLGRQWMSLVGKSEADLKKAVGSGMYLKVAIIALILSYVLAHFVDYVGASTISEGLQLGFWLWLGFVATTKYVDYLFAGRPMRLYAIDAGYHLVELMVLSAILAVWM